MKNNRLSEAVALIRSGKKDVAKNILIHLVREDPLNENAWLWLVSLVNGKQRIYCLEKVMEINPHHETVQSYLQKYKPQAVGQHEAQFPNRARFVSPGVP